MRMGFLLRVLEEDGTIIEEVVADLRFKPVRAGFSAEEYPMLGTLDPYGDTSLNYLQSALLESELRRAAPRLEEFGVTTEPFPVTACGSA